MVQPWQLWLSPRPRQRTRNTDKSSWYHVGKSALYEPLSKPDGKWVVRETHYKDHPIVQAQMSGPPLHIHRLQDEYFKVEQGTLGVMKNGKEYVLTKDDGVIHIPAGTRHRFFFHKSSTEDLVFNCWLDPCSQRDHILDVNFLRNLSGYLDDCHKAGIKPSLLQIILMTEGASSLICAGPLNLLPTPILFWVHRGLAWFAETVLGYEKSYPEYTTKY